MVNTIGRKDYEKNGGYVGFGGNGAFYGDRFGNGTRRKGGYAGKIARVWLIGGQ